MTRRLFTLTSLLSLALCLATALAASCGCAMRRETPANVLVPPPLLTYLGSAAFSDQSVGHPRKCAIFRLDNESASSIWFPGYGLQEPLVELYFRKGNRLQYVPRFVCGMDNSLVPVELPRHSLTEFRIELPERIDAVRIGLTIGTKPNDSRAAVVWSEEVRLAPSPSVRPEAKP
jgi:hypothetical protein